MHHSPTSSLLSRSQHPQHQRTPFAPDPASPSTPSQPTNDDIEAVIQMATSARPSPDGRPGGPLRDTRTQLFVGNLPYRVRWQDLKDLFRKAGTVLRADVSLGPDNRSRGYGTVLLATAEDAGRAVDMFNGYSWQTRILEVRPDRLPPDFDAGNGSASGPPTVSGILGSSTASGSYASVGSTLNIDDNLDYTAIFGHDLPANSSSSSRNLFVGNLPFHCQWQDLKDLFRQAGTVVRADVALGPDNRSRGFGTVIFQTDADAEKAVKIFNGYEYNGRVLKVHYDKFSQATQPLSIPVTPSQPNFQSSVSASPVSSHAASFAPSTSSHPPTRITLPAGYQFDYGPPSGPSSPYDMFYSHLQMARQKEHEQAQIQQQFQSQYDYTQLKQPQPQPTQAQQQQLQMLQQQLGHHPRAFSAQSGIDGLTTAMAATQISNSAPPLAAAASLASPPKATSRSSSSSISSSTEAVTTSPTSGRHYPHPHHPGPISLPPPPKVGFPHPTRMSISISPLHHPGGSPHHHPAFQQAHHSQVVSITPHGLPPITPSMPPFSFLPPNMSPHHHPVMTSASQHSYASNQPYPLNPLPSPGHSQPSSPIHAAFGHHRITNFSPGIAMSPGTFWGRPGDPNPFINPAVGAPVHVHSPGHGEGFFYLAPVSSQAAQGSPTLTLGQEPKGYFDPAYFPPAHALGPSGLANEIMKEKEVVVVDKKGDGEDTEVSAVSSDRGTPVSISDSGRGRARLGSASSSTTWYNSSESHDDEESKEEWEGELQLEMKAEDTLMRKDDNSGAVFYSRSHSMTDKSGSVFDFAPVNNRADSEPFRKFVGLGAPAPATQDQDQDAALRRAPILRPRSEDEVGDATKSPPQ